MFRFYKKSHIEISAGLVDTELVVKTVDVDSIISE